MSHDLRAGVSLWTRRNKILSVVHRRNRKEFANVDLLNIEQPIETFLQMCTTVHTSCRIICNALLLLRIICNALLLLRIICNTAVAAYHL